MNANRQQEMIDDQALSDTLHAERKEPKTPPAKRSAVKSIGDAMSRALNLSAGDRRAASVIAVSTTTDGTFYYATASNPEYHGHMDAKCRLGENTRAAKNIKEMWLVATVTASDKLQNQHWFNR